MHHPPGYPRKYRVQSYLSLIVAFNLIFIKDFIIGDSPDCFIVQLSDVFREENRIIKFSRQDLIFLDTRDDITPKNGLELDLNRRPGAMNK